MLTAGTHDRLFLDELTTTSTAYRDAVACSLVELPCGVVIISMFLKVSGEPNYWVRRMRIEYFGGVINDGTIDDLVAEVKMAGCRRLRHLRAPQIFG